MGGRGGRGQGSSHHGGMDTHATHVIIIITNTTTTTTTTAAAATHALAADRRNVAAHARVSVRQVEPEVVDGYHDAEQNTKPVMYCVTCWMRSSSLNHLGMMSPMCFHQR